jgi:hypothetical protein
MIPRHPDKKRTGKLAIESYDIRMKAITDEDMIKIINPCILPFFKE